MSAKFLVFMSIVMVINTVLFVLANFFGIATWKVVSAEVVVFVSWIMWKAWSSPAQKLVTQGASMGWTALGIVKDDDGMRDTLLERKGVVARISFQKKSVTIIEPFVEGPFRDFVEIERHLAEVGL